MCVLSLLSLNAQRMHKHGFQLALLSLSAFEYHLELCISIILIYLSAHVHIVYFVALQFVLLENLTLSLCVVCEFGIDCAQLIGIFECIVHRHRWISTVLLSLNASNYVHTLHYVWIQYQHRTHAHYSVSTLCTTHCSL